MGIEIERKFLLKYEDWRSQVFKTVEMAQGYFSSPDTLSGGQKASMRIRTEGERAFLNIKSVSDGIERAEFEYEIPFSDAEGLFQLCRGSVVRKKRHYVTYADRVWEIDEFLDDNAGLYVAEVEIPSADTELDLPSWVGKEVSMFLNYTNIALSYYPYTSWGR